MSVKIRATAWGSYLIEGNKKAFLIPPQWTQFLVEIVMGVKILF